MDNNKDDPRRNELRNRFLAGQIDRPTYDARLAEPDGGDSASVVSASLIVDADPASQSPDVVITASDPDSPGKNFTQPTALVTPGVELGTFRIELKLGRGGMGEVWLARDLIGERTVVIKLLRPEFVHHPDELASVKSMFQRVHSLQHQNICPLYLLGNDSRFGYYVVMKYVDGTTLSVYMRQYIKTHGRFPLEEVAGVLGPIAAALDYAHSQKIIHCDVKPQNIMIGEDGQVVQLVDFGLATEIRSSVSRLSSSDVEYGGTYPYMSPEQWRGETLDGRTDQYSLAVVAYELIAGRRPFQSADPAVLRLCALNDIPDTLAGVDLSVNAALLRGMAKSKSDRFQSCSDFVRTLCRKPAGIRRESAIQRANRRAAVWVSLFGGLIAALAVVVMIGLVSSRLLPNLWNQFTRLPLQGDPDHKPEDQNLAKPRPIDGDEPVQDKSNDDRTAVNPRLRYRWQTDRIYLYAVNIEIELDHDRVLTYAGNLTYSITSKDLVEHSDRKLLISCDGLMSPKVWCRSGKPVNPTDVATYSRPIAFSSSGSGAEPDGVETDSMGVVSEIRSTGQLPRCFGPVARLMVERLPDKDERTWSTTRAMRIAEAGSVPGRSGSPNGLPFGVPSAMPNPFRVPGGFAPEPFQFPFSGPFRESTAVADFPGYEKIDYEAGKRSGDSQQIQRTVEIKSEEMIGARPRIQLKGQGSFVFNLRSGLLQQSVLSAELTETNPNNSTTTPVKLSCRFQKEQSRPIIEAKPANQ